MFRTGILVGVGRPRQIADFGMMVMMRPFGPFPDSGFNQYFHSNAFPPKASNCSIFSNSELDHLLDEGAKEVDETKRSTIYKKVQDILNEEIPMLPLYINMDFLVLRKGLQGVAYPNAFIPFYEVSKDSHYVIIIRKKGYLDQLHIDVEAMKEVYEMGPQKIAEVEKKIEAKIRGMIGIGMKVKLVAPKSIARSEGKAKRVIDERTK